jgi:hypothetical protein
LPSLSIQPNVTSTTKADTNTQVVIPSPKIISINDENDLMNINQKGTGISLINNSNSNTNATTPRNDQNKFNDDDMSNETSEFIRMRQAIEVNTYEWLEQELIANFINKMALNHRHVDVDDDDKDDELNANNLNNEIEQDNANEAIMLMNFLGKKGFQLFVDMGLDVDSNLIELLIREVLEEKIANIIYSSDSNVDQNINLNLNVNEQVEVEVEEKIIPQPSPRKTLDYLIDYERQESNLDLVVVTPVPTPPIITSPPPTITKIPIIHPPQPPSITNISNEIKKKHFLVLEEEENFSELDVTLEQEFEEDDHDDEGMNGLN